MARFPGSRVPRCPGSRFGFSREPRNQEPGHLRTREPGNLNLFTNASHLHRLAKDPQGECSEEKDDADPRDRCPRSSIRIIAQRDAVGHGHRSCSAEQHESQLNRIDRTGLHPGQSPQRFAERRPAKKIDRCALCNGNDGQDAGEQVKAIVRDPDAQAERNECVGTRDDCCADRSRRLTCKRPRHGGCSRQEDERRDDQTK